MGEIEGTFVATQEAVDAAVGQHAYFGEVLGKHSEVSGEIEDGEIKMLTDNQDFITAAIDYDVVPSGFNPLDYISDEE